MSDLGENSPHENKDQPPVSVASSLNALHGRAVIEALIGGDGISPVHRFSTDVDTAVRGVAEDVATVEAGELMETGLEEAALFIDPAFVALARSQPDICPDSQADMPPIELASEGTSLMPAELMERQGYAKEALIFADQALDETRQTPFSYAHETKKKSRVPKTEHQGLLELRNFLERFVAVSGSQTGPLDKKVAGSLETAKSMLDNLTFIGKPEFDEAAKGIGDLWKNYLDGDPARKICVITEVGMLERYQSRGNRKTKQKSDEHLLVEILQKFTPEEAHKYAGRIVSKVAELDSAPEDTRIVLLDDWTISGGQMRSVYQKLSQDPETTKYVNAGCVEMNLIAASGERIDEGLEVNPYHPSTGSIPVKSYFKAHRAELARDSGQAHITGLHTSVNFGFYNPCNFIKRTLKGFGVLSDPSLLRVLPAYKKNTAGSVTAEAVLQGMRTGEGHDEHR